jgi:hypothetical protein
MISEWGWWGDEIRGESEVRDVVRWAEASPLVARYFHFCVDDFMVPPFGLYRTDGSQKPAGKAFLEESRWNNDRPSPVIPSVGWIGDGLMRALTEQGWSPTTGEHDETLTLVRAGDDMIVWDRDQGRAISYRRS